MDLNISLIIDIVLVLIIAVCAYRGFRSGLITSIIGVLAVVVALYGANLIATTYSSEFTGIAEPFVSGLIDTAQQKILNYDPASSKEAPKAPLTGTDLTNVEKVTNSVLVELGIGDDIAAGIAENVAKQEEIVSAKMSETIAKFLSEKLCFIAAFIIGFALIMIICTAIGNVLDVVFGLPGLENLNHILGGVLGAVKGVAIVLVIALMCRYLGFIVGEDIMEETFLLKRLTDSNMIASIFNL